MWWFLACHTSNTPNTPKHESVPLVEPPLGDLIQIEVGLDIICAIDTTHRLKCWGDHAEEALSHRGYSSILNEPPEGKYTQVALTQEAIFDSGGPVPACALGEDSEVDCWSSWSPGTSDKAVAVGVAYNNICLALVEGGGKCNEYPIYSDTKFTQIWTGYGDVCALTEAKDLECEQVGTQMSHKQYPGPWVDVTVGSDTCMLHQDQGVYCLRGNEPVAYFPDAHGTEICFVNLDAYCILQENGIIACIKVNAPLFDTPLQTISCSFIWEDDDDRHFTACGLVGDGTARCWNNYRGQWSLP